MASQGAKPKNPSTPSPSSRQSEEKFHLRNNVRVRVRQGDITKSRSGAVVAGENSNFSGQGAIARNLLRAGGPSYKSARDEMIKRASQMNTAAVHVSGAGENFKFHKVFHAVVGTPKAFNDNYNNWYKQLDWLYKEVGRLADEHQFTIVSTPLLGTGGAGGDTDASLQAALTAFVSLSPKHLEDVIIVEYDAEKADSIRDKMREFFRQCPHFLSDGERETGDGESTSQASAQRRPPQTKNKNVPDPTSQSARSTSTHRRLPPTPTGESLTAASAQPKPPGTVSKAADVGPGKNASRERPAQVMDHGIGNSSKEAERSSGPASDPDVMEGGSGSFEDHLTCPVCMELYEDPRVLPCQHSYCRRCLQQIVDKSGASSLQCPECRTPVSLGVDGARGLQKNYKLASLVECFQKSSFSLHLTSQPRELDRP